MTICEVHWRPSHGRGEFEFVPADSLLDRKIYVDFDHLGVRIDSEVFGRQAQGKPRLRKLEPNNRQKLHLVQFVMAVAALPEPARSDQYPTVEFPLENKKFVVDQMDFDIIDDDGEWIVIRPLRASVLHSDFQVNFDDRFRAMARDFHSLVDISRRSEELAEAIKDHENQLRVGLNSSKLRNTADRIINLKTELFGQTNAGSALALVQGEANPEVDPEEITGREGRLLTRIHVYKERDRSLVLRAKNYYRSLGGGKINCEACGLAPEEKYGASGERAIEAHHKIPIEQLQPDSETRTSDLAMVCATCHRVIHSRKPCFSLDEIRTLIAGSSI